jgi:Zn-dependent peptidase ImmA (M78 family)/DNA-binding XRE family transcriptional regulator
MELEEGWAAIGERVRRARAAMRFSQEDLGRQVGLDRTMIAKIEAGTRRIDGMELARLSSALGVPMRQFLHDPPEVISRRSGIVAEETTAGESAAFRLDVALVAWLNDMQQLCEIGVFEPKPVLLCPSARSSSDDIRDAARWLRRELGFGNEPLGSLMQIGEQAGVLFTVVELEDGGEGASIHEGDLAVSVINLSASVVRRRSTAAHELGHMVLGDEYVSDMDIHASKAEREAAIDAFAAELLLPVDAVAARGPHLERGDLIKLSAEYQVSWSLALRQAERTGLLDSKQSRRWGASTPTKAELRDAIGWLLQQDLEKVRVPPSVAHAIMRAYREGWIAKPRAAELMRGHVDETELPDFESDHGW